MQHLNRNIIPSGGSPQNLLSKTSTFHSKFTTYKTELRGRSPSGRAIAQYLSGRISLSISNNCDECAQKGYLRISLTQKLAANRTSRQHLLPLGGFVQRQCMPCLYVCTPQPSACRKFYPDIRGEAGVFGSKFSAIRTGFQLQVSTVQSVSYICLLCPIIKNETQ